MWSETRTRGGGTMKLTGLEMRPVGSRCFEANLDFQLEPALRRQILQNFLWRQGFRPWHEY
jgi:hypothetical protein